jgi:predicted phosphodiesterase
MVVEPGHHGALDVYVPVVDWGLRFPAIRFPARLRVDVLSVDRDAVSSVAGGHGLPVAEVRADARDAIAAYLRVLLVVVLVSALALGTLTALALRVRGGPRVRWSLAGAAAASAGLVVLLALTLPPRGRLDKPEYYAHGGDVPRALRAIEDATRSSTGLSEELDDQLVGLARLVSAPARRPSLLGLPRITVASDLHNNVLAFPTLEQAAAHGPLFFVGDLTDRGSPFEIRLTRRVVRAGRPFVFVSGNHDSDTLVARLVREGAIVLTRRGRLLPGGRHGPLVVRVAGLRVAGYDDPFERRRRDGYRGRLDPHPALAQQQEFAAWLAPLVGKVDVVMVHEPQLARLAIEELRARPPRRPLVLLVGHTHVQSLSAWRDLAVLNSGTAGAGGVSNLDERRPIGIAVLTYRVRPGFAPVAADLVAIDPGTGSARAQRTRLDLGHAPRSGD